MTGPIVEIGVTAPLIALAVLTIPSLLTGVYAGIQTVDSSASEGVEAAGMGPAQEIFRVIVPLASPTVLGGIRAAALQAVATDTLVPYTAVLGWADSSSSA